MEIRDISERFLDNANKYKKRIVLHWTASNTAKIAIEWLDMRKNGKGTVGYNYIIEKDGVVYMLADPAERWMHNTGLGGRYDMNVIAISFVNKGDGIFTEEQYRACRELIEKLKEKYEITMITHHHKIYKKKPDFPERIWEKVKDELGI